jgi:hypothetical protein
VAGAAPEKDAVRLRARIASLGGGDWTLDPFCLVPLGAGHGECAREFTQAVESAGGRLTVTGTLLPSGRALSAAVVAVQAPR